MPLFNLFKPYSAPKVAGAYVQQQDKAGLLVTAELDKALQEVSTQVSRISKECKSKNRKFRDKEFDLENDKQRCLHGIFGTQEETYIPSDVQRVTEIFDNPQFFVDGADSNDIVQGKIGDCWFVSALATVSTAEGLVEKFCVARDEEVGVYGFIFFRDGNWQKVIIDDLLYTSIPKFEELNEDEKALYHNDKLKYNESARKGGKGLYFAKSGTPGETWVALIEKAYAKLHGSYAFLSGGQTCEAVEDLTGGVSSFIPTRDILDTNKFWNDELLKANKDRLFGCSYGSLDRSRGGGYGTVNGLISSHAYSVLRAVEVKGKRFVVVRNPWGKTEWTGPWSDGSKEWTREWLDALSEIGHSFGDDGQFVMSYEDFLSCWEQIDRTLLFDSSWVISSQWLHVRARPLPSAWTYGDVSFTISLAKASPTIIVLSQLDDRYFTPISGRCRWMFDFVVFKKGEKDPIAESSNPDFYARSVNMEVELEAGDYVVHVRLDREVFREQGYFEVGALNWDQRQLSRVLSARASGRSNAINFKTESEVRNLPFPLDILAGQDLQELEKKANALAAEKKKENAHTGGEELAKEDDDKEDAKEKDGEKDRESEEKAEQPPIEAVDTSIMAVMGGPPAGGFMPPGFNQPDDSSEGLSEDDSIFLGLRVYSYKDAPVSIEGQLRREMELSARLAL